MKIRASLALATLALSPLAAQDLCEGNGHGEAYIEVGPAYLGGYFSHDIGSPNAPGSFVIFSYSDGFQETIHPVLGSVCLNVFSPTYGILVLPTDGAGNLHFDLALPPIPGWVQLPPFYSNAVTFESGSWSSSKTVPLYFENPDSWTPISPMSTGRLHHTATFLGADGRDNRIQVLVAGGGGGTPTIPGATRTTEVFNPLNRAFTPGPDMTVERSTHTATRLDDGRVLIAGGLGISGACHRSCEIYDHSTGTMTPTGNMNTERGGHTATLLDDGRVLVTGGFQDYSNPTTAWAIALGTAQNSAEIYDPSTGLWTPVTQPMSGNRAGHTATKLADGTVLVVNGIEGGKTVLPAFGTVLVDIPTFTSTVDLYTPSTDSFTPLPDLEVEQVFLGALGGRAFHGTSLLSSGNILVCGGVYAGGADEAAVSTNDCHFWDGSSWTLTAGLAQFSAWHGQMALTGDRVTTIGGLEATGTLLAANNTVATHDGIFLTPASAIGLNPGLAGGGATDARGCMTTTRLHDGSVLVLGGYPGDGLITSTGLDTGYIYTPNP